MARRVPVRSTLRGGSWLYTSGNLPASSRADTKHLAAQLQRQRLISPYTGARALDRMTNQLLTAALRSRTLPDNLHAAFATCARELVACEAHLFELPRLPPDHSVAQAVEARAILRDRLALFENAKRLVGDWIAILTRCLSAIIDAIPPTDTKPAMLSVPVPVVSLVDSAPDIVRQIVADLMRLAPDPRAPCTAPGATLAARITENLLATSRISFEQAQRHPERLKWPGSERAGPPETVRKYLVDTPFATLFESTILLPIPERIRFEGAHLIAKPGHGKSQCLQYQILKDIDDPRRPAVFVIDSSDDMLGTLARLARFDPAHDQRLVIINAGDTPFPLRINPFDLNRRRIDKLDLGHREEVLAGIVQLLAYIFEALSSDLTGRQELVLKILCQWMLNIPGATIHTMTELLTRPGPYLRYTEGLTATAQRFINDHLYSRTDKQYADVCNQLHRRLFELLSVPAFERCLSAQKNTIDFHQLFDTGSVVLINTARARLKNASPTFGKIIISMILQAILERAAQPEHLRRPVFGYIDECAEYFDGAGAPIDTFLLQGRKFKSGLTLCHQNMEGQVKRGSALRAALMTTALRFVGEVSVADAATLAPEMKTTSDYLLGVRRREASTEFAVHVRNVTPSAIKLRVPFFVAENAPKMSDAAYAKLLDRIRSQVASPLATAPPKLPPRTNDPPSPDDDFGEKY